MNSGYFRSLPFTVCSMWGQKMSPFCHAEEQCGMQSRFTHLLQEARMAGRQVRGNCDIQQGVVVDCTVV